MLEIVSREQWGAAPPRREPYRPGYTNETYLHHSAGPHSGAAGVRAMQDYHQSADPSRDKAPWNDIAYNHIIDPDTLTVFEGRGWGVAPGAQRGHNVGTWAVCVMGDFRSDRPSPQLLELIAELIRYGHDLGYLPLELTGGHKDAPDQATSCPGPNLHREIPTIRTLLEDTMPSIEEIRAAIREEAGEAVLGAEFGGPVGSSRRMMLSEHIIEIKNTSAATWKKVATFGGGATAGAIATEIIRQLS